MPWPSIGPARPPAPPVRRTLYLSAAGAYSVAGLSNGTADAGGDVFGCDSPVTGEATSCAGFSLYFRANDHGLTGNLDAVSVP